MACTYEKTHSERHVLGAGATKIHSLDYSAKAAYELTGSLNVRFISPNENQ